ncbi:hypothetical protein E1265_21400 [Streptomyces sp. 8K308]|uniref:hypothetical protein n=1 Tax=Streptomyces sp. 8K308 TaxID=2530388 RepID=UPI00104EC6B8|nr:hypothetical protein [Streptomyces sp. 8K308]TDC20629.1 hypothetical protein E1265_21400 [Streptomyces sp. 8K308]
MTVYVGGAVRREFGARNVAAVVADPPEVVECRVCRRTARPREEAVSLGALVVASGAPVITAWSHRACAGSKVLTHAQFTAEALPATLMSAEEESTITDPGLIVEGEKWL